MKKTLALTLFASTILLQNAGAANPDQDLIVDLVRERFAASKEATLSDLQPGKNWRCTIYSAQRGIMPNYNSIYELFTFKTTDDLNTLTADSRLPFREFKLNEGIVTSKADDKTLYARVTRSGGLVFENVGPQPKKHKAYRAIANSKLRGLDYIYCKTK